MTYIQGFVIPVPAARRADYLAMAQQGVPVFTDHGALRIVECWGDDVPHGERTDFYRAVQAGEDETIVYSWIVWPDRATCDAAAKAMMTDERMQMPESGMPFDGKRLIYAGFTQIMAEGVAGAIGYVDGFVVAVPTAGKAAYLDHAAAAAAILGESGLARATETWGEDVPHGTLTDFHRAVDAQDGETVVFSWLEWPDKATRDTGMAAMMADPRIHAMTMPFDGQRMIYGGFVPIMDTGA